ncbi:MAG: ATP-binding cassette domain-containing protein [Lachnospiraceae bacterium]|nr:ATP-binding cassette domain-containing protein [Lachnospiraceae bacterium]
MLLEVKGIEMTYPKSDRKIFENISLELDEGSFTAVTGPSGSGKSTFLANAGGYLKPTAGKVIFENEDLYELNDKRISEIHANSIGYVPQSNAMFKKFNVLENILMYSELKDAKGSFEEKKKRAGEIAEKLKIDFLLKRYPYELSGGELKRVSIARALINSPKILIADEPTTGLDRETGKIILDFLSDYRSEKNAVLLATHDDEVLKYADKNVHFRL